MDAEDAFSTTAGSDGKTCTISGYKGNAAVTTLYIPKEMGDKEVTAIAANVFAACPYLKNVVIKNDIDIAAGALFRQAQRFGQNPVRKRRLMHRRTALHFTRSTARQA
ncbi:MAG: hypothetical protein ACLTS6_04050 [Anaerobutyricum sp.]